MTNPNATHMFIERADGWCGVCGRNEPSSVHGRDGDRVDDCAFCSIVAGYGPVTMLADSQASIVIEPLSPAAPGHALVIPRVHVADATTDPEITAATFRDAVTFLGRRQGNVLTSVGPEATQTVMHLHVHVIPRGWHDTLHEDWPWHRALYDGIRR